MVVVVSIFGRAEVLSMTSLPRVETTSFSASFEVVVVVSLVDDSVAESVVTANTVVESMNAVESVEVAATVVCSMNLDVVASLFVVVVVEVVVVLVVVLASVTDLDGAEIVVVFEGVVVVLVVVEMVVVDVVVALTLVVLTVVDVVVVVEVVVEVVVGGVVVVIVVEVGVVDGVVVGVVIWQSWNRFSWCASVAWLIASVVASQFFSAAAFDSAPSYLNVHAPVNAVQLGSTETTPKSCNDCALRRAWR